MEHQPRPYPVKKRVKMTITVYLLNWLSGTTHVLLLQKCKRISLSFCDCLRCVRTCWLGDTRSHLCDDIPLFSETSPAYWKSWFNEALSSALSLLLWMTRVCVSVWLCPSQDGAERVWMPVWVPPRGERVHWQPHKCWEQVRCLFFGMMRDSNARPLPCFSSLFLFLNFQFISIQFKRLYWHDCIQYNVAIACLHKMYKHN